MERGNICRGLYSLSVILTTVMFDIRSITLAENIPMMLYTKYKKLCVKCFQTILCVLNLHVWNPFYPVNATNQNFLTIFSSGSPTVQNQVCGNLSGQDSKCLDFSKCLLRHDVVRVYVSFFVLVFVRAILSWCP